MPEVEHWVHHDELELFEEDDRVYDRMRVEKPVGGNFYSRSALLCVGLRRKDGICFLGFTARLRSPRFPFDKLRGISGKTLKSCPDTCLVSRQ
jgi:hypothetical protein